MKFTANFCSWSHVAYFCDTTVGFWLCNKIIPTIKTISMQVFHCVLREFCRSWLALINALPSPCFYAETRGFTQESSCTPAVIQQAHTRRWGDWARHALLSLGEGWSTGKASHPERRYCHLLSMPIRNFSITLQRFTCDSANNHLKEQVTLWLYYGIQSHNMAFKIARLKN